MVHLRNNNGMNNDCDCETCTGGEIPQGENGEIIFGGWRCCCPCHHKKDEGELELKEKICKVTFKWIEMEHKSFEIDLSEHIGLEVTYRGPTGIDYDTGHIKMKDHKYVIEWDDGTDDTEINTPFGRSIIEECSV